MVHLAFRILQYCATIYLLTAVIFTTWLYVLSPVLSVINVGRASGSESLQTSASHHGHARLPSVLLADPFEVNLDLDRAVPLDDNHWAETWPPGYASSEMIDIPRSSGSRSATIVSGYAVREETLLSKAFSDAIHPTRIIPFYFKATGPVDLDDVTITTLVTNNRFRVFKQLVERYRGPISVTIHIPLPLHSSFSSLKPDHPSRVALDNLHALYASSPLFSEFVDVHPAPVCADGKVDIEHHDELCPSQQAGNITPNVELPSPFAFRAWNASRR